MKITCLIRLIIVAVAMTACSSANAATPEGELTPVFSQPRAVVAEGKLLPDPSAELAFLQSGIVAEIFVKPGDMVAKNEVIARLVGSESLQAELDAFRLEQLLAKQNLEALQRQALLSAAQAEAELFNAQRLYETEADRWNPTDGDEATNLERRLDDYVEIETAYRNARQELEDLLDQDDDNRQRKEAQEEFDEEKTNLDEAYADLLIAVDANDQSLEQRQIDLLQLIANLEIARELRARLDKNIDPDSLSTAEARLTAISTQISALETAIANYELRAPFAGTLLSMDDLRVSQVVNAGIPVAYLADVSRWQVETTDLPEIDIASVALGASTSVKLDAFPGEEFAAKVVEIDPFGREHLGDMTYRVTLQLDESDPRFLWNMTATVTINVE